MNWQEQPVNKGKIIRLSFPQAGSERSMTYASDPFPRLGSIVELPSLAVREWKKILEGDWFKTFTPREAREITPELIDNIGHFKESLLPFKEEQDTWRTAFVKATGEASRFMPETMDRDCSKITDDAEAMLKESGDLFSETHAIDEGQIESLRDEYSFFITLLLTSNADEKFLRPTREALNLHKKGVIQLFEDQQGVLVAHIALGLFTGESMVGCLAEEDEMRMHSWMGKCRQGLTSVSPADGTDAPTQ